MSVNKYIYQLIVGCLTLFSCSLVSSEYVPVFMWESSKANEIVPALPRISQETFKEIIQQKLDKKSLVVIFAEPNLSSEDFGEVDSAGNKVFAHLSNLKAKTTYLPFVDDPIDVLRSIYKDDVTDTTVKNFNKEITDINSKVLIVDLDDVQDNETRNEILQRHDRNIYNMYEILKKENEDVFAIFTSYHTSWIIPEEIDLSRSARSILATRADGEAHLFETDNLLLYVSDAPTLSIRSAPVDLSTHNVSSDLEGNILTVNLSKEDDPGVELVFTFTNGYWILTSVTILGNDSVRTALRVKDISAPAEFSYQCNTQIFYQKDNADIYVSFPGMQVQPFREMTNRRFGDVYYCVGFTTAPIWSGIFVAAILITIMSIGLSMMMDIRTMDRFDDPKGKTIQINVSE